MTQTKVVEALGSKKKKKPRATVKLALSTIQPPKDAEPPVHPSSQTSPPSRQRTDSLAKTLASAALAVPGSGPASKVIRGILSGAAAGTKLETAYRKYKSRRATSKAKKAKTSVTQSALQQKKQYHKKDLTNTEKV